LIEGLFTPRDDRDRSKETPLAPGKPEAASSNQRTAVEVKPLTVSALASRINETLTAGFPDTVRVLGEISNFSNRTHWYFAVKDAGAVLNCVMFAGRARSHRFVPANGQSVVVTAKVEVYEPQGKLTLIAEKIEPVGAGALDEAYQRLVAELRGMGWFEPERKRALPVFARRVAVITSRKGAALADVLNTMARRCPGVEVCLIDCLVQGGAAAPDVTRAVQWVSLNAAGEGIDALLVTRGGGSMEDLWAFNDRSVAEAVRNCRVPVVAAIGHETDVTIVELVADARASTPTQAAMLLTPDREALRQEMTQNGRRLYLAVKRDLVRFREGVASNGRRLAGGLRERLGSAHTGVARLSTRLERCRPATLHAKRCAAVELATARIESALRARLRESRHTSAVTGDRLHAAQRAALAGASQRLASASRQLELIGPVSVLRRGYSVTYTAGGRLVRAPQDVKTGDPLVTRLAEGRIESTVGKSQGAPLPRAGPRRRKPADDGTGGLFGEPEPTKPA